ncbi:helix-turn-helix domain-containing protein [Streptomyces abikoensis]|uniref:helix-turn-helix domain-containing protein n=1 Tax=Streptomyces abikoensis TaxID=97398 RepID=UPI0036BBBF37
MGATLGRRLRDVRKRRGLSQRELAALSGVSLSLIRKLEQAERDDTRLETAHRLAVALRVPTSRLVGDRGDVGPETPAADQWEAVRRALTDPAGAAVADEPPTLTGVREALDSALPLFSTDRYAELGTILPALIRDADALAGTGPDGKAVRARLMQLTGWLLTQNRQFGAAHIALERALVEAPDSLHAATSVSTQCWLLLRQGRLGAARELATRWADEVEPRMSRATPAELSAWGWLLLRHSAASVRDNRPDEADQALRLAHSAAIAMGREFTPEKDFLRALGPVTVRLKRAENALIADRPDHVLQLAERVPATGLRPTSNNRNRHLLDVAEANVRLRRYAEAVDVLEHVRTVAPQWLPNQRYAQDILGRVIERRRTLTPGMRSLADAIGVPM